MPKSAVVTLGGKEYTLREKTAGQHIAWRTRLEESRVYRVVHVLESSLNTIVNAVKQVASTETIDWSQMFSAAQILPILANGLLHSMDDVWELLFEYSADLKTDREWILENAYDEEGINAFLEVLKFCFPIMALWAMVTGSRVQPTASNGHSQSTTSGLPASGPRRKK